MKEFTLLLFLYPILCFGQVVKPNEKFTNIYTLDGKVVFLKEISLKKNQEKGYLILREWGKSHYAKDPFVSSISFYQKDERINAKSRIELLLPANDDGVREKITMKYRLNASIIGNLCVLEFKDITYSDSGVDIFKKNIKAEDLISDQAIAKDDSSKSIRLAVRKSTLYFFNELAQNLQNLYGDEHF